MAGAAPGSALETLRAEGPGGRGSLEIDAVAEEPASDPFFDFLAPLSLFENKAPGEVFDGRDLMLASARALLLAYRRKLPPADLELVSQVVLCSRATEEVQQALAPRALRSGIVEGRFVTRLVLVEANGLPLLEENLPVILHFASGEPLLRAVEHIIDLELRQHYHVLMFLRRETFKEVLAMKDKTIDENEIMVREAVEELGIARVVDAVGLQRVIAEIGLQRVIAEIGLQRVIAEIGLEQIVESVEPEQLRQLQVLIDQAMKKRAAQQQDGR